MSQFKTFVLNGKSYCTKELISIFDLLLYFNYNESLLVLEHNKLVCQKQNWKKIFIKDNDNIEIVTIVGGG